MEAKRIACGDLEPSTKDAPELTCSTESVELSNATELHGQQEPTEEGTFETVTKSSVELVVIIL